MYKIIRFAMLMAKYLVKQWNTYYAEMRIPKDVAHVFGEAKFCYSLQSQFDYFIVTNQFKLCKFTYNCYTLL